VSTRRIFLTIARKRLCVRGFVLLLVTALFVSAASVAQDRAGDRMPVNREEMWSAPTTEDWKKPCLITWQRTWEDALAVSRETGKPILVCVNMDGEIASEHYAGKRYRDPEIAKLYEPYVCVIASVYRHTPRDYDEQGQRILCPRFGCVTCGEHIAIEPGLFKEFFDDRRIAPRHIGVELDGRETYDVYYAFDTDSVFEAIREGVENRTNSSSVVIRSDRPILERVESRDIRDRKAVERAYLEGDKAMRRSLLEAAIERPEAEQVDLLRLAVFGFDVELNRLARHALARSKSAASFNLITEALRAPMETPERDALIDALARLGESSPRARMLSVVHQGLAGRSSVVDVEGWSGAFDAAGPPVPLIDISEVESRIENQGKVLASGDALQHLELAVAFLVFGHEQSESEHEFARSLFTDAHDIALKAEMLGAYDWRVSAVIGLSAYQLGDTEAAYARAETAVSSMPPGEMEWSAMAVIELFAMARRQAIAGAVREKKDWSSWSKAFAGTGEWLTDLNAAYSVLTRHPYGNDTHAAAHYDFLKLLGAVGQACRVLDEGLARFPSSWSLHDRLRGRVLKEKGAGGLEPVYETMLREKDAPSNIEWYAGYASLVTAEFCRRAGEEEKAVAAYERGIDRFNHWIEENLENRDTADHYVALAIAGCARIAFEREEYENALAKLIQSFERKPGAAATLDGLNISPADTARMLLQKLREMGQDELVAKLEAAMAELDPELLRLPAYEREGPNRPLRSGRRGRRRGL